MKIKGSGEVVDDSWRRSGCYRDIMHRCVLMEVVNRRMFKGPPATEVTSRMK